MHTYACAHTRTHTEETSLYFLILTMGSNIWCLFLDFSTHLLPGKDCANIVNLQFWLCKFEAWKETLTTLNTIYHWRSSSTLFTFLLFLFCSLYCYVHLDNFCGVCTIIPMLKECFPNVKFVRTGYRNSSYFLDQEWPFQKFWYTQQYVKNTDDRLCFNIWNW